jgi:hypothetical protein
MRAQACIPSSRAFLTSLLAWSTCANLVSTQWRPPNGRNSYVCHSFQHHHLHNLISRRDEQDLILLLVSMCDFEPV